jgi:membrane-bound lytic murein transglycosylase B
MRAMSCRSTPPCPARRRALTLAALLGVALPAAAGPHPAAAAPPAATFYADPGVVQRFVDDTAAAHGLDPVWVAQQLQQARHAPVVRRLIMPAPPGVARNWTAYRARFVEPRRVQAGLGFWRAHEATLARAEAQHGVPAAIVVGIIGVETFYGRVMGNHRALDALATLAFDFPPGRSDRSAFFRDELGHLLAWSRRESIDPGEVRSSFAGAIGWPQFMPSSIGRWAVDFDGDGRIDLRGSATDAVGSVAHYLAAHGWQRGLATHHAVTAPPPGPDRDALLAPSVVPSFSAAQLAERGALLDEAGRRHEGLLALIELEDGGRPLVHVAGTQNFFVITRYNRSSYYALAVIELAAAVAAARTSGPVAAAIASPTR